MNNILTLLARVLEASEEDEEGIDVLRLPNGKLFEIQGASSLINDTADDFMAELLHKNGYQSAFLKDLRAFFHLDTSKIGFNWMHWSDPQEMYILYKETWTTLYTMDGTEQDVEFEYVGIIELESLNEANCYKEAKDVEK